MSHTNLRQPDQLSGDACLFHDVPGEDEKRNRQEYKFTCGRGHQPWQTAHDGIQRPSCSLNDHGQHTGRPQTDCNRCSDQQQNRKYKKQYSCNHQFSPPFSSVPRISSISTCTNRTVANSAPMGTKEPKIHSGHCMLAVT